MIAIDTNILVYAQRAESPWHRVADRCITRLAEGDATWAIPLPCLHEFFSVVTNPRIYRPCTPPELAAVQIESWLVSPTLVVLTESPAHWQTLKQLVLDAKVTGGQIHDARVAALCIQHGVSMLWSADRDFSSFPRLKVANPLL